MDWIDRALDRVKGPSHVLLRRGMGFETQISLEPALVLGGGVTPRYFKSSVSETSLDDVPYALHVYSPRVLLTPALEGEINDWIGFLEGFVQNQEALLIVSGGALDDLLLRTFVVNLERETFSVAVCGAGAHALERLAQGYTPEEGAQSSSTWSSLVERFTSATGAAKDHFLVEGAPDGHVRIALPIVDTAVVRRQSTILFPRAGQTWRGLEDVAVIEVGGRNRDAQEAALLQLAEDLDGR